MASGDSLTNEVERLRARHNALDAALTTEQTRPHPDEVQVHALKKQKLKIKDELARLDRG
ncbi:MAG: DUF465 domain-containing protein [Alphaproteobacteria bacterium]|nr:DUF465 domain-containing protein [Alphaproteobacteria bacterium]